MYNYFLFCKYFLKGFCDFPYNLVKLHPMLIQHREDETTGTFYLEENGDVLAEMVYSKEPGKMIILHTEVDESLRGQNIGLQLVQNGIEFAREQDLKVV